MLQLCWLQMACSGSDFLGEGLSDFVATVPEYCWRLDLATKPVGVLLREQQSTASVTGRRAIRSDYRENSLVDQFFVQSVSTERCQLLNYRLPLP